MKLNKNNSNPVWLSSISDDNPLLILYKKGFLQTMFNNLDQAERLNYIKSVPFLNKDPSSYYSYMSNAKYDMLFSHYQLNNILQQYSGKFEKGRVYYVSNKDIVFVFTTDKRMFSESLASTMNMIYSLPYCTKTFQLGRNKRLYTAIYNNKLPILIPSISTN